MSHGTEHPPTLAGSVSVGAPPLGDIDVDSIRRDLLRFPSADLVHAAVGLFPTDLRSQSDWGATWFDVVTEKGRRVRRPVLYREGADLRPGSWPRLHVGPGIVQLSYADQSAVDRSREAANRARGFEVERQVRLINEPMWSIDPSDLYERAASRFIQQWSSKSQGRLIQAILGADLNGFLQGRAPAMVTLTLPGDWLAVAPDAASAARIFSRFEKRYARKWGEDARRWIWKREFQRRGAPHWHLWLVPPTEDRAEYAEWVALAWAESVAASREVNRGHVHRVGGVCDCSEFCRNLAAGTHVSYSEGLRASDPKRLALYFLKESGPVTSKAYQNRAPVEWAGQSVGRFWGLRGIDSAVASVELDPEVAVHVWRVMRKIRRANGGRQRLRVDRLDTSSGVVRIRTVHRRPRVARRAGWVALNDAPAMASALARYVDSIRSRT